MNYDFNEEQSLLKESARKFLSDECPATYVRRMAADERGCSAEVWNKMVELGWLGLPFPEEYGGSGMDFLHLAVLLAEMGYACMPGPFFSTVVLGGIAVLEGGTEAQKKRILEEISSGRRIVTLAWIEEDGACSEQSVRLKAHRRGDRYVLTGVKLFVPDAHVAGTIVCAARTEQPDPGLRLFLLDPSVPGVTVHRMDTMAGDRLCEVVLDGVAVADEHDHHIAGLQHVQQPRAVVGTGKLRAVQGMVAAKDHRLLRRRARELRLQPPQALCGDAGPRVLRRRGVP